GTRMRKAVSVRVLAVPATFWMVLLVMVAEPPPSTKTPNHALEVPPPSMTRFSMVTPLAPLTSKIALEPVRVAVGLTVGLFDVFAALITRLLVVVMVLGMVTCSLYVPGSIRMVFATPLLAATLTAAWVVLYVWVAPALGVAGTTRSSSGSSRGRAPRGRAGFFLLTRASFVRNRLRIHANIRGLRQVRGQLRG